MTDESDFVRVARLEEIPEGGMMSARVGDEEVVVYNVGGTLFASRDGCTHQNHPLSKGALRGKYIRCSLHGWEFDVTTGEYQGDPQIHVRCFPVKVENGEVWVGRHKLEPPPRPFISRDDA